MAGSEKSGYQASKATLLENKICIICTEKSNKDARILKSFWESLKMTTVYSNSTTHDLYIGLTSHFIHLLSYMYIDHLKHYDKKLTDYTGPAFKEFNRLANSDIKIWGDIFIDNRNILNIITRDFTKSIKKFQKKLNNKDIYKKLESIKDYNKQFTKE